MRIKRNKRQNNQNEHPSKKIIHSSKLEIEKIFHFCLMALLAAIGLILQYYFLRSIANKAWPHVPWHQFYRGLSNEDNWISFMLVEALWFLSFGLPLLGGLLSPILTIWFKPSPPATPIAPAEKLERPLPTRFLQEAPEVREKIVDQVLLKIRSKGFDYASIEQNVLTAVNIHGKPVTILIDSSEGELPKLSDVLELQKVLSLSLAKRRPCFFAPVLIKYRLPYPGFRNQIEPSQISFDRLIPIEN